MGEVIVCMALVEKHALFNMWKKCRCQACDFLFRMKRTLCSSAKVKCRNFYCLFFFRNVHNSVFCNKLSTHLSLDFMYL